MGKFWQKMHFREHPERKMVPDPFVPEIGGSSPRCTLAEAILGFSAAPQMPLSPLMRLMPQS
jgi:hypothetical protein